jgi:hypothetical protein
VACHQGPGRAPAQADRDARGARFAPTMNTCSAGIEGLERGDRRSGDRPVDLAAVLGADLTGESPPCPGRRRQAGGKPAASATAQIQMIGRRRPRNTRTRRSATCRSGDPDDRQTATAQHQSVTSCPNGDCTRYDGRHGASRGRRISSPGEGEPAVRCGDPAGHADHRAVIGELNPPEGGKQLDSTDGTE